jgi:hypothetical protein
MLLDVRLRLNPEPGIWHYLGGSEGLWGFRERQFAGTTRVLLIGEERKYFGWRPWNLLQPGIAAFAEVAPSGVPERRRHRSRARGHRRRPARGCAQSAGISSSPSTPDP